jgi:hypothetical protein
MANWATVAALGDPSDPAWQQQNLTWIEPIKGQRWQVYKPAQAAFEGLLGDLIKLGYHPTSSGGFNYRNIRGGNKLSQHAFGTAIDINAMTNPLGQSASDIPHAAELARKWGLEWGGNWKGRPDPMHFEYAGGSGNDTLIGSAGGDRQLTPQQQWMQELWQYAQAASQKTGVDPRLIMAQAALETGYGKSAPNNNYFGIKGPGEGQKTLEFINGRMTPTTASFRTYKDPEESFNAYANFLMGDRYAGVRGAKGLAAQVEALGKSGYATDPDYAKKILAIAQGIPEGGFGAGGGGAGGGATATASASPASPYTLPEKKENPRAKFGAALADAVSGMGGAAGQWQLPQIEPVPEAARVDAPVAPVFDPQVAQANRDRLAQIMAALNQNTVGGRTA